MLTYKNDPALRQTALDAMATGLAEDRIVHGSYMCGGRGCAVGVLLLRMSGAHSDERACYADATVVRHVDEFIGERYVPEVAWGACTWEATLARDLGLPWQFVKVLERVFEELDPDLLVFLPVEVSAGRVMDLLRAVPVGIEFSRDELGEFAGIHETMFNRYERAMAVVKRACERCGIGAGETADALA